MAKNDKTLLDGIIEQRLMKRIPSNDIGEVFEYFAVEQILKDYALSEDNIFDGSVDGKDDGGVDDIFIFSNGHYITQENLKYIPKSKAELEIFIVTCKHHDTFQQSVLNDLIATLAEILDFSLDSNDICGKYNNELLNKRDLLIKIYKNLASILETFKVRVIYASRGESSIIDSNIIARADQIVTIIEDNFSNCDAKVEFIGSSELLQLYRKQKTTTLELKSEEILSQGSHYIFLAKLIDFYNFIKDEDGKLRRYLFDSNVRDYEGLNRVNSDIMNTLNSENSLNFWLLNNGVTILTSKASSIGKIIHIENTQIVNGLQTSETIFNYFSQGGIDKQNRSILIKVLKVDNPDVRDEIIYATNNQTGIMLASLHATDKIQKDIEDIMSKHELCYERRKNFYLNKGYSLDEIFTPLFLASGYVNLILKMPYKAVGLKYKFMNNEEQNNEVFSENADINIWPQIAKILKKTDRYLGDIKKDYVGSTEKFLKCVRQITSFISLSRYFCSFNFSINDIVKLNIDHYNKELVVSTWQFISSTKKYSRNLSEWTSKKEMILLCEFAAKKFKIENLKSILNRENSFSLCFNNKEEKKINEQLVEKINDTLAEQPWKPGEHKRVANLLGYSPFLVSKVISILINRGKRNMQKDGIVYNKNGEIINIDKDRFDKNILN